MNYPRRTARKIKIPPKKAIEGSMAHGGSIGVVQINRASVILAKTLAEIYNEKVLIQVNGWGY